MKLLRKLTSADSAVVSGTANVRMIYWLNPVNIGDTVVLQDGSANEQITLRCEVAAQSQVFEFLTEGLGPLNGSKVSTLASGTVYLYG